MSEKVVERKDKLKLIALADVIIGERFRVDLGDIEDLMASIADKGIIQPISVDENMNLLAGGRRCESARRLGLVKIPAIIRPFKDEIDSREIELMENIHRKDFTWDERARLTAEIDKLYKKNNREWSARKTADLIDRSKSQVARDLELAQALEALPELANCETADEASKLLKKLEGDAIVAELRKRQDHTMALPAVAPGEKHDPLRVERDIAQFLRLASGSYKVGDAFKGMASFPSNGPIGFIECDPPYGIDLASQKGSKDSVDSTVHGYEEVDAEEYPQFLKKLAAETYRVAARDCWMVFWYGPTWHQQVLSSLQEAGWAVDSIPAIWVKATGQTLQPQVNLARSYEPFFVCRKGKPVLAQPGRRNVFEYAGCPTSGPNAKIHPTERPIPLIEELFETFILGSHLNVLVPFAGSGNTLRAAFNRGLRCTGFDIDGKYKDKFMLRVEADVRANMKNDGE